MLWFDGSGPDANTRPYSNCAQLTPLHSADVTLGYKRGDDDIVIAVTPRRVGTVRISGVEVHYSSGLRHATLHTGAQLNVTSPPAG